MLWEPVKSIVSGIDPTIDVSAAKLANRLQKWKEDMNLNLITNISWVPNDYDPPSYGTYNDTREEISAQKQDSEVNFHSIIPKRTASYILALLYRFS